MAIEQLQKQHADDIAAIEKTVGEQAADAVAAIVKAVEAAERRSNGRLAEIEALAVAAALVHKRVLQKALEAQQAEAVATILKGVEKQLVMDVGAILDDGRTYVVDLKRIKRVFATILEAFFINGLVASVLAGFMFVIYVIYVIFVCARAAYRRWWM